MMREQNVKKVAIYARVSTTEQAEEGYSIDEQVRVLNEYCTKEGYEVFDEYIDRGISGKNITSRPAVQRLLVDAEYKAFDMVLVWKMNRLARKSLDLMSIVDKLNSKNIAFRSYTEKYETESPTGKLQFQMMAAIAEYERNNIAENVKMGMIARAKDGSWNGGQVLGYDVITVKSENKKKKQTRLEINMKEASTVRKIFELYTSGYGYKSIANQLNKNGYRTKKDKTFSLNAIKSIVTNPIYAGYIRYNVRRNWNEKRRNDINPDPVLVKGKHTAIITQQTWQTAQNIYKTRSVKPNRIHDGEFPLTGIMRCPQCDAGMVIGRTTNRLKSGEKRVLEYYVCGAWKNKGTVVCKSNGVRTEYADKYVLEKIETLLQSDTLINRIAEGINTKNTSLFAPLLKEKESYVTELERLENRLSKVWDAYTDELISKAEFALKQSEIQQKKLNLKSKLEPLENQLRLMQNTDVSYAQIKLVLASFAKAFEQTLTREQRKRLFHLLINRITISSERTIESIQLALNNEILEDTRVD